MSDAFSTDDDDFRVGEEFGGFDVPAGEQYTSTIGLPIAPKSTPVIPEKTVRPFESYRERRDQRLAQLRQLPEEENIAQSCWGGVTNGDTTADDAAGILGSGITSRKKDDPGDQPEEDPVDETWKEIQRASQEIEVASEEDPEVKVTILVARTSILEIPSLTVSKTSGSGKNKTTTTITIPQRKVRVEWVEIPADNS